MTVADVGGRMVSGAPKVWESLDSCAVSDALDRFGHSGVVSGIVSLGGDARIVGRAVTVELGPVEEMTSSQHLGTAAIEAAPAGDVIAVAHRGRTDCAGWGGNPSRAAPRRGLPGRLIAVPCRRTAADPSPGY